MTAAAHEALQKDHAALEKAYTLFETNGAHALSKEQSAHQVTREKLANALLRVELCELKLENAAVAAATSPAPDRNAAAEPRV